MRDDIWVKVLDNHYYIRQKCSRCGAITTKDSSIYHGEHNRKGKCKIICENCLQKTDYVSLDICYNNSGRETFEFLQYAWNVEKMYDYAVSTGMKTKTMSIESFKTWNLSNFIRVDDDRLEKVDMTKPCVMVNLSQIKNEYLIIDGNHRCRRAINGGIKSLEFYAFDFKEQFKFMLNTEFRVLKAMIKYSLKE